MTEEKAPGCAICSDPRREEIDRKLILNIGVRIVAKELGLAKSTLGEHRARRHHATALASAAGPESGAELTALLRENIDTARTLVAKATSRGDLKLVSAGLAEVGRCVDLLQRAQATTEDTPKQSKDELIQSILKLWPKVRPGIIAGDPELLRGVLAEADPQSLWAALLPKLVHHSDLRREVAAAVADVTSRSFDSREAALATFEQEHAAHRERFFPEPMAPPEPPLSAEEQARVVPFEPPGGW
jgi:hypothetical protein